MAAVYTGLLVTYIAITEGTAGEIVRTVGVFICQVVNWAWEKYRELEAGQKVKQAIMAVETIGKVAPTFTLQSEELAAEDNINVVKDI